MAISKVEGHLTKIYQIGSPTAIRPSSTPTYLMKDRLPHLTLIDNPPTKYISDKRLSSISYSDELFYFHVKRLTLID